MPPPDLSIIERALVPERRQRIAALVSPVAELAERLDRLCRFANGESDDGDGRTARAAFYWSMRRQGYWLTEFLTSSTILRAAPAQYARRSVLREDAIAPVSSSHRDLEG